MAQESTQLHDFFQQIRRPDSNGEGRLRKRPLVSPLEGPSKKRRTCKNVQTSPTKPQINQEACVVVDTSKDVLPPPPVGGTDVPPVGEIDVAEVPDGLKGVSAVLLNKIRAKEAASRAVKAKDSGKIQMLTALPQMVFILRSYFSVAKKPAISWKQVTAKIVESSSTFSTDHVDEYLEYLGRICQGWISFPLVGRVKYVKINKKTERHHILSKIDDERNRLLNT